MDFTLNGRTVELDADPGRVAAPRPARAVRPALDEGRLRARGVVRRLHRHRRRPRGRVLRPAGRAGRGSRRSRRSRGCRPASRDLWADAFVATGASQCGYCSPGIVMKAEALLRREPAPTARGHRPRAGRQPLPLHRVRPDHRRDRAGRRRPARRAPPGVAPVAGRALRGPRARPGREAVRRRPRRAGHAPRRAALRRACRARSCARIDTTRGARGPGRGGGADRRGRPRPPRAGAHRRRTGRCSSPRARPSATWATCWPRSPPRRARPPRRPRRSSRSSWSRSPRSPIRSRPSPTTRPRSTRAATSSPAPSCGAATWTRRSRARRTSRARSFRTAAIEHAFLEPEAALAVPRGATGPDGAPVTDHRVHVYSPGPGRLGGPPPGRLVPGAARGRGPRHPGLHRRRVRRQGGPQRPGPGGAARASRPGRPVLLRLTRRESLRFHVKRHPMWLDYTAGCDAEGTPRRGPGADRRRQRRLRERRRQGPGARRRPRLRPVPRAQRGRRGHARSTPTTRRRAPCAASAPTRPPSRSRACWTCSPSRSASTAGRSAGATRSTWATGPPPASGWARASACGRRCSRSRTPTRAPGTRASRAASRTWASATGSPSAATRSCARRPTARVTLFHSWTEMGQGCHTVFRDLAAAELGIDAGPDPGRGGHAPRAGHRRDHLVAGHDAGRARGPAGVRGAARGAGRRAGALEDLAGRDFAGEVVVDWTTKLEAGRRRAGHPLRLRLGDPGRHPRRRGPRGADRRGPRRGPGAQPGAAARPGRGRRPHGPGHGADRGVRDRRTASPSPTRSSRWASSRRPRCPRWRRSSWRSRSPRGRYGAKGMGEAVLVPTAAAVAGALLRVRRHPPDAACRCATRRRPGRCCRAWPARRRRPRRRRTGSHGTGGES